MSGNEEQSVECPLCMEPLEMDDINFFPCTCGYQICRFCWHRIRTDENGLCPACRKQYPEDPADFKPLTQEELQKIKTEKRQKDILRKQKLSENRKHLANVRVVQKNLVFVVGLSQRLADPEVLKKQEYFGKFGKIHKVVINHSTSYAGSQGPSASAYVTYHRAEDALRAIQAVNNIHVDGRTLKASLGTTKYCSHFLKGQQCPKPDCMYLHELGDEAASFTKEEMQQGKHQEYERKLHEHLFNSVQNHQVEKQQQQPTKDGNTRRQAASPTQILPLNTNSKDAWPSLQSHGVNPNNKDMRQKQSGTQPFRPELTLTGSNSSNSSTRNCQAAGDDYRSLGMRSKEKCDSSHHLSQLSPSENSIATAHTRNSPPPQLQPLSVFHSANHSQMSVGQPQSRLSPTNSKNILVNSTTLSTVKQDFCPTTSSVPPGSHVANYLSCQQSQDRNCFDSNTESDSFFSNGNALPPRTQYEAENSVPEWLNGSSSESSLFTPEALPVQSTTDWQAAFGFGPSPMTNKDDDLGFDPWDESAKALADLMEKESRNNSHPHQHFNNVSKAGILNHSSLLNRTSNNIDHCQNHNIQPRRLGAPPGFSSNHVNSFYRSQLPRTTSIATGDNNKAFLMSLAQRNNSISNGQNSFLSDIQMLPNLGFNNHTKEVPGNHAKGLDSFNMKGWHEGLCAALIPNFNINSSGPFNYSPLPNSSHQSKTSWNPTNPQNSSNMSWQSDPTVISSDRSDSPPHWMRSLQQLTEVDPPAVYNNHRLPFTTQFTYRHL